jgi:hypothetical protein
MARDDGVKIGAGGKSMLQEIVEVPTAPVPLAKKQNKEVEVLEERLVDLPSDTEPEVDDDENI